MPRVPTDTDLGLRLVILYKTAKGAGESVLALLLAFGAALGLASRLQDLVALWAGHLTRAWSLQLAELAFRAATPKHLQLAAIALGLDGMLTSVEGWGLWRRKPWAEWLVVVASGLLLPFEFVELVRHASIVRFSVLAVNLLIVGYLARRIVLERARAASRVKSEP